MIRAIRPDRLVAHNLTLGELSENLERSSAIVSGGYLDRGAEAFTLRAVGMFGGSVGLLRQRRGLSSGGHGHGTRAGAPRGGGADDLGVVRRGRGSPHVDDVPDDDRHVVGGAGAQGELDELVGALLR